MNNLILTISLQKVFSNREIAFGLFIICIAIWLLKDKNVRNHIPDLIKTFFQLRNPFLIMNLYFIGIIYLLYRLNYWNFDLLKDTIYWYMGGAFIFFVNVDKVEKKDNYFKQLIFDNIKLVVLIGFIANIHSFNLAIEILTGLIVLYFSIIYAFTENKPKDVIINKIAQFILIIYGSTAIIFSLIDIIQDFKSFATFVNLRLILLPILLTILFLPYMYFFGLYMIYEMVIVRIKHILRKDRKLARYGVYQVLLSCNLSLRKIKLISKELKVPLIEDKLGFKNAIKDIFQIGKQRIPYMEDILKIE